METAKGERIWAKAGPVSFSEKFKYTYQHDDLNSEDAVFYDIEKDELAPADGCLLDNDFSIVFTAPFGLSAGVLYHFDLPTFDAQEKPKDVKNPNPPLNQRRAGIDDRSSRRSSRRRFVPS